MVFAQICITEVQEHINSFVLGIRILQGKIFVVQGKKKTKQLQSWWLRRLNVVFLEHKLL